MVLRAGPLDTEITIRSLMPSVLSPGLRVTHADTWENTGDVTHLHTTHAWVDRTYTPCPPHFALNDLSARIYEKWFSVMKQTTKSIFLYSSRTKQAMALFFVVDSLYKRRQWVLSFPITPHTLSSSPLWTQNARTDSPPNEDPQIHRAMPQKTSPRFVLSLSSP